MKVSKAKGCKTTKQATKMAKKPSSTGAPKKPV